MCDKVENLKKFCKERSIDFFFPISVILCIVPLIVRMAVVKLDDASSHMWGTNVQSDLFSQKKAFWLMVFSIILIAISIIFFKKIFEKKDKTINAILIAAIIFLAFTLLSTIFSKYGQTSLWGVYDRAEGFVTIACYLILFIYSIYTFKNTENYKYVIWPIIIVVLINSFLGIFQYVGDDLLKSDLGTLIALPSKYRNSGASVNLLYEKGKLYGTLFHYNYVGSFVAIVIPILLGLFIVERYYISYKLMAGFAFLGSIWLLFGSSSRAGIIGVSASIVFAIIMFGKVLLPKWKGILIFLVSILVIAVGLNFATKGAIFERVPSLISDAFSVFKSTSDFDYRDHVPVRDIKADGKNIDVVLQNETLKISYEDGNVVFKNSKDEVVNYVKNDKIYSTDNENFKNITFNFAKLDEKSTYNNGILLNIDNKPAFIFRITEDGSIHLVSRNSRSDIELEYPETFGFNGKEKLGSARGYIWSRSIPLIKNNLIIGGGPDSFIFQFPQNDLIGKYYAYDTPNMLVDKPHNLYLQMAINDGVIALLAFLAIVGIYVVDSFKLYALRKDYDDPSIAYGSITCLGVIGYLFAGLFNDSVISVAPVFWIVLGVGVALNYMNRKH